VDTIVVTAGSLADSVVDTLVVLPPLVLALSPASRADTVVEGSTTAPADSADVVLTGTGAGTTGWTATHGAGGWLALTTASGTGSGVVRWSRTPTGLTAGTYVDTIVVTAGSLADSVVDGGVVG
jgi:hypothetical protein